MKFQCKRIVWTVLGVSCGNWINASYANDELSFGVGVEVTNTGSEIYIPVDYKDSWRIEPSVSFNQYESRQEYYDSEDRGVTVSLGVFHKLDEFQNIQPYLGVRIGYGKTRWKTDYDDQGTHISETVIREFSPVVGLEYRFTKSFSLASELAYSFERYERWEDDYRYDYDRQNTNTTFIARFLF